MTPPPEYKFGYFSRNKYKDLVFYVETGEFSNCGLFETPDTPENRALMEALSRPHTPAPAPEWTEEEVVMEIQNAFDRGVAVGEQSERERVLDELISWLDANPPDIVQAECADGEYDKPAILIYRLKKKIASLRSKEGQP
jgi:hypothetical protein